MQPPRIFAPPHPQFRSRRDFLRVGSLLALGLGGGALLLAKTMASIERRNAASCSSASCIARRDARLARSAPLSTVSTTASAVRPSTSTLQPLPAADGVTQFDLPLAPLAPGEYYLLFTVKGASGPVDQRISFRITG